MAATQPTTSSVQTPLEAISGLVERVTFHSAESGFCVLRVELKGSGGSQPQGEVTVVGAAAEVHAGEWIEARGRWSIDPSHGRQFRAQWLRTHHPNTPEAMEKYLASGLIRGIGPTYAKRIVETFGTSVFAVIEREPKRLGDVPGIGPQRRKKIISAWRDQREVRQILVFLHSHGVGTARAFRIYKTYGEQAIELVKQDPYRLARDIRGVGFKTADQIAQSIGIDRQSDLRARAGVEFVLRELTDAGHCAFPRQALVGKAAEMLQIAPDIIEKAIDFGLADQRLVEAPDADGTALIYLDGLYYAEKTLAANLLKLADGAHPCPPVDVAKAIEWVESRADITLAEAQRSAIAEAVKSKLLVITGGPGVGKTTVVNAIVKILAAKKLKIVLAAPSGRAAKRLSDATGLDATTIHRLLEFDPAGGGFKHHASNPLEGDVFVIDETSMVDLMLAHQLVQAIPQKSAVIFVGDVDQLPPVGPGSVLRDLIASEVFSVIRLTEIFRQAAASAIVSNAHRVNAGQMPVFPARGQDASDFYFIEAAEPEEVTRLTLKLIQESIPRRFGLHPLHDIQVITPMQRGELGARKLNLSLQAALNPIGESVERFGWIFRVGDKVMQVVNNYDKAVFNGDIGAVMRVDAVEQELHVRFDAREIKYDFNDLDELSLAYAMTVHKSQGSEYPAVVIPIHTKHYALLQRNLLYTAMTRGRKLVVLIGSRRAIAIATKRLELSRRITTLAARLRENRFRPGNGALE